MSRVKIGVLISGSGSNLQSIINRIENNEINGEISVVISNREKAFGLERAKKHNIYNIYINPKDYSDEEYNNKILNELKNQKVELVILAGYLRIINPKLVKEYENRIINIHPSLIPAFCGKNYYGLKVHQSVVDYGVKISGATVHFVNEIADDGPIIMQKTVKVTDTDTAETLQEKILKLEHVILPEAVKLYCDNRLKVNGRKVTIIK